MNEIEVKILKLKGLNQYSDLLCSVYSNNSLLDVFSLDPELNEPVVFSVPNKFKQKILITVKSVSINLVLGFIKFRLDDLLDPEFVLTLPISAPQDSSDNRNLPSMSLQLATYNSVRMSRSKSETDPEYKKLRKKANFNENYSVIQLRNMTKTQEKFGKKLKYFKNIMKKKSFDFKAYRNKVTSDEFLRNCEKDERESKELILKISEMEREIIDNKVLISKLRAKGLDTEVDIKSKKLCLKIEKMKEYSKDGDELEEEVQSLIKAIHDKELEIELFDKVMKDTLSQILYFQESNKLLRENIGILDEEYSMTYN